MYSELAYTRRGSGDPLVLIHGIGHRRQAWDPVFDQLAESYDDIMVGLDHDRRDILAKQPYFDNPDFSGPQPVDEDVDGALCRAAVRAHLGNFHMPDFISEFRFTDDRLPYDPSFGAHSFSPYHYADGIRPDRKSTRLNSSHPV